jgi:multiple sugar transport system substrate-binding protein
VTAAGLTALLALSACNSKKTPAAAPTPTPTSAATSAAPVSSAAVESSSSPAESSSSPASSSSAATNGEKVTVTWFVGLGTGADQGQPEKEQKVVDAFNASQNEITLKMTVVQNVNAAKTLATQLAGGKGPDVVGPVGIKGTNQFEGQWLDLAPLIESQHFDTSVYSAEAMKSQTDVDGKQVAIPFGVYPSMVWYNKDLFDEAGIDYPPAKFGDKYADGSDWTWDKLRELAKKLTLDSAGKDATDPAFNPDKVVQWGYHPQFGDTLQHVGTMYGAGSFGADDKKTAQIPPQWLQAWKDRHDMIWKDHSVPNAKQFNSDTLNKGNAFQTGKIAMATTHLWYQCCLKDSKNNALTFWDLAAMPSYNGKITAPLHADTFRLMKGSQHPEAAFKVLAYFLTTANADLLKIYGSMPAIASQQDDFFKALDATWTQHPNWQVVKDALNYADVPNHESWTPAFVKTDERAGVLQTKINTDPKLDLDAEAKTMQADMQKLFDAAGGK